MVQVAIPIYRLGRCRDMDEVYTFVREKDIMVYYELKYTGVWEVIGL